MSASRWSEISAPPSHEREFCAVITSTKRSNGCMELLQRDTWLIPLAHSAFRFHSFFDVSVNYAQETTRTKEMGWAQFFSRDGMRSKDLFRAEKMNAVENRLDQRRWEEMGWAHKNRSEEVEWAHREEMGWAQKSCSEQKKWVQLRTDGMSPE